MSLRNLGVTKTIALAISLVGVILLPFGIVSQVRDQHFRDHAKQTQSISIKQVSTPNTRGGTNIEYSYKVDGRTYTSSQTGLDYNEHLLNQTILYDPANPAHSELANSKLTTQGLAFGLAVFFLLLACVILVIQMLVQTLAAKRQK